MVDKRRKQRIARENGRKSKGPITPHGKLMSSINAFKHGLASGSPSTMLVSDDADEYRQIINGLKTRYSPTSPLETHLIEVAAMAMVKQKRLWSVDATLSNIEIVRAQQQSLYPDTVTPGKKPAPDPILEQYRGKTDPWRDLEVEKLFAICDGIMALDAAIANPPQTPEEVWTPSGCDDSSTWLQVIDEAIGKSNYYNFLWNPKARANHPWAFQIEEKIDWLSPWVFYVERLKECADDGIDPESIDPGPPPAVDAVLDFAQQILKILRAEKNSIEAAIAQYDEIEQGIQESLAYSKAVINQIDFKRFDVLDKYQRCINRDLYQAIDRLETIRRERMGNEDSGAPVGSFGHFGILEGRDE